MKKILILLVIFLLVGCNSKPISRSNLALDTIVSITLYKNGSDQILDKCFEIINKYNKELDSYSEESLLSQLNEVPKKVSPEVYSLLETNINYYNKTEGLFNPTLGSLIELWDINEPKEKEPPSEVEINKKLNHIDPKNLILNNMTVSLLDPEEKVNLGASTKGFIADRLSEYLKSNNITSALINLGGNICLVGDKNGENFVVGIDNPDNNQEETIGTVSLKNKSIVTSGISQRYFTDHEGNIYHHILNPKTGYPENNDLKEVVVISDSSLNADILSTSLFLMGKDKAMDFIKDENNTDIILVTKDNKIFITRNLADNFKLNKNFKDQYEVIIINEV